MTDFLMGGGYEKWLREIGITDSTWTRDGLGTALRFFHVRMPDLPRSMRLNFLKGMDLHSRVLEVTLLPPQALAAFRKCNEDPMRLFYTKAGVSVHDLGINPQTREFRRFRVARPVIALQSRCAPAIDKWTDERHYYVANGGGLQFIIPNSYGALELAQ